jgi:hypothetical protein
VDIIANGQQMQESAVAIGERLIDVKQRLEHGQFGDWCATEFGMSQRTAQNLMNVARTFAGKSETVSLLSDSALYLLAAPSTPEPARAEVIEETQATGKSPTKQRVREIIAKHKPAAQPELRTISYADLSIMIEDEIAPTCDLATVDRDWLYQYILDRLRQRNMTAPADMIARVVGETAYELQQKEERERRLSAAREAAAQLDLARDGDRPLPAWVDGEPDMSAAGVVVLPPAPAPAIDDRIPVARRLILLYQEIIATEDQYGMLTGRFADTLAVKRGLVAMIGHLESLIAAIEHPEAE